MELARFEVGLGTPDVVGDDLGLGREAVKPDPEDIEILTRLGAALIELGRYPEAEVELGRAYRIAPDQIEVRTHLGVLCFRRGLYEDAESHLRWVCEQDPGHRTAHLFRGEALNRLGRVEAALPVLERASHLDPGNARAHYLLGLLYARQQLPGEAEVMFRRARQLWNS